MRIKGRETYKISKEFKRPGAMCSGGFSLCHMLHTEAKSATVWMKAKEDTTNDRKGLKRPARSKYLETKDIRQQTPQLKQWWRIDYAIRLICYWH